jgi:transcriptional regulator with XRE-family HTH domain
MMPAQGFGLVLREYRILAGLTQQELAECSGLSVRAVSDMERGRSVPHTRSVGLLADALGLDESAGEQLLAMRRCGATEAALRELRKYGGNLWHVVPRQLPAPVRHFTAGTAEQQRLDELLCQKEAGASAVPIAVISGPAGVGKTALAVHWAHQMAGRFGDGQLYVNLRGFDAIGPPLEPSEVVSGFLTALGVPASWIPVPIDARAALLRSVIADRNILIVADNAKDSGQVRPLLPGSSSCYVVVTSRYKLTELVAEYGACPVTIGHFNQADGADGPVRCSWRG